MTSMAPSKMTMQECFTRLGADDVIAHADAFFAERNPLYGTFPDERGPGWASFRGQGGEELIIAAVSVAGGSRVTGSSYLFTMQVMRFFTTLPAMDAPAGVS
jgi:hypothetical protein